MSSHPPLLDRLALRVAVLAGEARAAGQSWHVSLAAIAGRFGQETPATVASRSVNEIRDDVEDVAQTAEMLGEGTGGVELAAALRAAVGGAPDAVAHLDDSTVADEDGWDDAEEWEDEVWDDDVAEDVRELTVRLRSGSDLSSRIPAVHAELSVALSLLGEVDLGPAASEGTHASGYVLSFPVTVVSNGDEVAPAGALLGSGVVSTGVIEVAGVPATYELLAGVEVDEDGAYVEPSLQRTLDTVTGLYDEMVAEDEAGEDVGDTFTLVVTRADGQPVDAAVLATIATSIEPNLALLGTVVREDAEAGTPGRLHYRVTVPGQLPLAVVAAGLAGGAGRGMLPGVGVVTATMEVDAA